MAIVKYGLSVAVLALMLALGAAATASPPSATVPGATAHFAVIGDYGTASQSELDVANLVHSWNPEFIMTVGDNNYPLGEATTIDPNIGQYYHDFIAPYTGSYGPGALVNKFWPALGNHDWYTAGAQAYLDFFTLPNNERYYEKAMGPVHLFAIDSDPSEPDGITYTSTQALWLQSRLALAPEPWKLVYLHHAPFSSGPHGSTAALQWPYQQWGASAVLAGHDHDYERILSPGTGFPYFVDGLGGTSIYPTGFPVPGSVVRYSDDYGAMLLDATSTSLQFQFINRANYVVDIYTMTLGLPSVTPTPTRTVTGTPTATRTATLTNTPSPTASATAGCGNDWQLVPNPNIGGLSGVAAVAANDIWAVGGYDPGSGGLRTLVEHWDGQAWTVVPSPNQGPDDNNLFDVAVVSATNVWTVGIAGASPLIEHWDGQTWQIIASPSGDAWVGLAVVNATDIWTVGHTGGPIYTGQIAHWNGTQWALVPAPDPNPGSHSFLRDVTAVTATDVWAVGDAGARALAEHWDGTQWNIVATADPPAYTSFRSVAAVKATDVWAVGDSSDVHGALSPLVEHWDGTQWAVSPSPAGGERLYQISAVTPTDVWAVGDGNGQPLVEHWDGTAWQVVANPPVPFGRLYGLARVAATDLWAVGYPNRSGSGINTLIEHYSPSCGPTLTATPTNTALPATASATAVGTPSPTVCPLLFTDVLVGSTFYDFIRCLACRGFVSGYPCGGPGEPCPGAYFRPGNNVTRGQTAKIVSNAAGYSETPTAQTFEDVPPTGPFYLWVERIAGRGIISGYPCGGMGEPCVAPANRPYFRPNTNVTRGQLAKIDANAAGYTETPTGQTFEDAPPGSTFYLTIERIAGRGIISGYPCGGAGEPCVAPANRPYFRPSNAVTRGQTSKIVANTFFPNCQTPARR